MKQYNNLQDNQLVSMIQKDKDNEKALSILINRHSGLCIEMINRYTHPAQGNSVRNELIKDKGYHIYHAVLKFNPNKGSKFSTYLGNEMRWKCLNIYNKSKRHKSIPVEEELIDYFSYCAKDKNEDKKHDVFENIISYASKHPDERVGRIFNLRYVVGKNNTVMPWSSISSDLNMSIQGCINIHDLAMSKFKQRIRKEINE